MGLPLRLTRFFGREAEAVELLEVTKQTKLLTLVGAPGCGKTRLAIEVAERLESWFPGGVAFVDLAPVVDPELLASTVATACGIREEPGQAVADTLVAGLGTAEPLLLLLDNCEHLVDAVADLVLRLIRACPGVQVMATSRVALGLDGEQVWRVPPLGLSTGTALFVDRALLASSDFVVDNGAERVLEDTCRRLDGLPLAIELTAAWTRVLSLGEILHRLDTALLPVDGNVRSRDERHRTMRSTVDWSCQLLDPADQQLFAQLSVFAGSFDVEAATAVADPARDAVGGLTRLVDQSLVQTQPDARGGPMRFRLLEPLRQCAAETLAAGGEEDVVRARHADHFLALVRAADPLWLRGRATVPFSAVRADAGNLLAAFDWARRQPGDLAVRFAVALGPYWEFGSRENEGRAWLRQLLDPPSDDRGVHALGLHWAGRLAWRQGDYADAARSFEKTIEVAGDDEPQWSGDAEAGLALVSISTGQAAKAGELAQSALARYGRGPDVDARVAGARLIYGWSRYLAGDVEGGNTSALSALELAHEIGQPTTTAATELALSYGAMLAGDPQAQRDHLLAMFAALDAGGVMDDTDWMGISALLAIAEGRLTTAGRLQGAALSLSAFTGSQRPPEMVEQAQPVTDPVIGSGGPARMERLYAEGRNMSLEDLRAAAVARAADDNSDRYPLTARECEVVDLVAQGLNNVQIAERLFISRRTVESHLEHIRRRLDLSARSEIVAWALAARPQTRIREADP